MAKDIDAAQNPFSFSSFIGESSRANDLSGDSYVRLPHIKRTDSEFSETNSRNVPEQENGDNPFSYRHFLRNQNNDDIFDTDFRQPCYHNGSSSHIHHSGSSSSYPLPDFVPNHSHPSALNTSGLIDAPLEDLYDQLQQHEQDMKYDNPGSFASQFTSRLRATGSVPDFLRNNDTAPHHNMHLHETHDAPSHYGERIDGVSNHRVLQLEAEVLELRRMLSTANSVAVERQEKIMDLKKELKLARSCDSTDTGFLEQMVKQIEENLRITTQRAINAENTATSLSQQNAALQIKVSELGAEIERLRAASFSEEGSEVLQKAKFASEQLTLSANAAESNIKQLCSGVDSLRLLASMLSDIAKIQDVTEKQTKKIQNEKETKPDEVSSTADNLPTKQTIPDSCSDTKAASVSSTNQKRKSSTKKSKSSNNSV